MSSVEQLPLPDHRLTEFDALVTAAPNALDAIPGAVYICDRDGWLVRYNAEAVDAWGRMPRLDHNRERFCGSHRLFLLDGTPLPKDECPMAEAVQSGTNTRNAEVVMERPDGSRFTALVNIRALRDHDGNIQGAINCFQDISARKAVEEEVQRKKRELEDFFENTAIGLHIVSAEGIIQRANKAELDLLGYSEDEYVGRHIAEFHTEAPVIGDILHRLSRGEKLDRYPARLRAKDGTIKSVLLTSTGHFKDGRFTGTRCFTTDVTELHEAEERLAATHEAATVGIAETDREGRFLRVNDALCRIYGRSREELLNTTFLDVIHEDDRDEDMEHYSRQVRGELTRYSIRNRSRRPDGQITHLDAYSSSVLDPQGRFLYGVRVVQDVTEPKLAQDSLRESEGRIRDLLEALPAAIYTTDAKGRITFYNKAAVQLAGRTPELNTNSWCVTWRLYWPDGTFLPHDECPMAISLKEGRPIRGAEALAERPDGGRVPFLAFPTPLHDADGNLTGAINMLVDITERKQAESRQKVLIDELNHRVKNTLATVQSLASQTARHAENHEAFVETFSSRLLALSRAHDLLTKRHWEGTSLALLAGEVVGPFADIGRTTIKGPYVELTPREAISLTMAFSELLTNAAKYGALSSELGGLSVSWTVHSEGIARKLEIEWAESGGPTVVKPSQSGFGTRLIALCVERDLDGALDLDFAPSGLRCRMSFGLGLQSVDG